MQAAAAFVRAELRGFAAMLVDMGSCVITAPKLTPPNHQSEPEWHRHVAPKTGPVNREIILTPCP